ncbi:MULTISPECIES: BON domain-containing protein [Burkholderia]|uniref:BON domain-containing protein n=1 Tax=Burkholderia TaxID=32008 RepID=UPI0008412AED|nr:MULTISPECIES: BON domain-containing protein [unclassified Burkholderia]AOK32543.1 transporter [Burkholderia sp. Bp7605]
MDVKENQVNASRRRRCLAGRLSVTLAVVAAASCVAVAPSATAADGGASSSRTVGAKVRDATLTAKVKTALTGTAGLSSGDIHVRTRHGNVTLTGSVPDDRQRAIAIDVVKQIDGVRGVHDQLTIASQ